MLFYFTATGNCLYVAKQFEEKPISIPQIIHQENLVFEDESIGIVYPVYAGEPPKMVQEFLNKVTFKTNYLYVIATYGKDKTVSPKFAADLLEKRGIKVDYAASILMVDNYIPSFDMEEEMALDKKVEEQLEVIVKDVKERKRGIPQPSDDETAFYERATKIFAENPHLVNGEQITVLSDKCIGCGICTRVCPANRFVIKDGKATRTQNTCEFCLACAHACLQKAIITSASDKNPNARYRNPHVTLQDIIQSNQQTSK